jgi:hypothetical protein
MKELIVNSLSNAVTYNNEHGTTFLTLMETNQEVVMGRQAERDIRRKLATLAYGQKCGRWWTIS